MLEPPIYPFDAGAPEEQRRLAAQAKLFDPITEQVLTQAGLGPGMRVLDLGAGAGDVTMLAARLVGPTGSVVGVDMSAAAVQWAQRRVRDAGFDNVTFVHGDITALDEALDAVPALDGQMFDAVVGRLVLIYVQSPAAVLAAVAQRVRPGGLICVQELDVEYTWSTPHSPLWDQVRCWSMEVPAKTGHDQRLGLRLHQHFRAAGLPAPRQRLETMIGSGSDGPVLFWANAVRASAPLLEKLGIVSVAELSPDTLADRLLAETEAYDGIVIGPLLVSAWIRTADPYNTP